MFGPWYTSVGTHDVSVMMNVFAITIVFTVLMKAWCEVSYARCSFRFHSGGSNVFRIVNASFIFLRFQSIPAGNYTWKLQI
jgi:hypothetical protein